jgi:hypothetical protein
MKNITLLLACKEDIANLCANAMLNGSIKTYNSGKYPSWDECCELTKDVVENYIKEMQDEARFEEARGN